MNIYSVLALFTTTAVLIGSFMMASDKLQIFVDNPSFFIVLGGTFASAAVSFHFDKLFKTMGFIFKEFIQQKKVFYSDVIKDIMAISEGYRGGESLDALAARARDPFLKEAVTLLADGVLEKDQVIDVLSMRAQSMSSNRFDDVKRVKSLSKYPPAYGMMGTVIGMVVLLGNLNGADAIKMVGPAMGVCLLTTLYGLVVANLVFIPIGDNLDVASQRHDKKDEIIIEGIKHILKKSNPILIAEELNSFLLPQERLDWKTLASK